MIKYILGGLIVVALVVLAPLAIIWSINTLFSLAIPYTIETWLAAILLAGSVRGGAYYKK